MVVQFNNINLPQITQNYVNMAIILLRLEERYIEYVVRSFKRKGNCSKRTMLRKELTPFIESCAILK